MWRGGTASHVDPGVWREAAGHAEPTSVLTARRAYSVAQAVLDHVVADRIALMHRGREIAGWRSLAQIGIVRLPQYPMHVSYVHAGWVLDSVESATESDAMDRAAVVEAAWADVDVLATDIWRASRAAMHVRDDRSLTSRLRRSGLSVWPSHGRRLFGIGDMELQWDVIAEGGQLAVQSVNRGRVVDRRTVETVQDAAQALIAMAHLGVQEAPS